jgi:hypothetical protein
MAKSANAFKGRQFTAEVILWAVRRYLQFPVSFRDVERMLADRGVSVDHTTVSRWTQRYASEIEKRVRPHLRMTNGSWRVDETYIKVKGRRRCSTLLSESIEVTARCEAENDHGRQEPRLSKRGRIDEESSCRALRACARSSISTILLSRIIVGSSGWFGRVLASSRCARPDPSLPVMRSLR